MKYLSSKADFIDTKEFNAQYNVSRVDTDETRLHEIELVQDSTKMISSRESTQILDFLGDIGGFKEALLILLVTIGEYFSSKFFIAKVAKELYKKKKTDDASNSFFEGGSKNARKNYKEDKSSVIISSNGQSKPDLSLYFESISFSSFVLLVNPFFETLFCGKSPLNLCRRSRE